MSILLGGGYRPHRFAQGRLLFSPRQAIHPRPFQYYFLQRLRPCLRGDADRWVARAHLFDYESEGRDPRDQNGTPATAGIIGSMHDSAAFDDEELAGDKVAVGAGEKHGGADDVCGRFDAAKGALPHTALAPFEHFVGN